MPRDEVRALQEQGVPLEIDRGQSAWLSALPAAATVTADGRIQGFPCYRTVDRTYADLAALARRNPNLARWVDYGDSWDKATAGGEPGSDLRALGDATGIIEACFYEPAVNRSYAEMASHYDTAIVPARVRKPRDKAAVESAVEGVNKRVIGYLAEEVWTTVEALNSAINERVTEINTAIRRADGTTRWERFESDEAPLLAALPDDGFATVEWKQLKVGRNYHVSCDSQYYSVPYTFAGQLLRVRLTAQSVTLFDGDQVVCEHPRRHT